MTREVPSLKTKKGGVSVGLSQHKGPKHDSIIYKPLVETESCDLFMEKDSGNESDQKTSNLKISSVDEEAYESDTNRKAEKEKNNQKKATATKTKRRRSSKGR